DRAAKTGSIDKSFSMGDCIETVSKAFGDIDPKFADIIDSYLREGQIDWKPRQGKHGGGYCSSLYGNPTFVLLNHINDLNSFKTFAHEMGHAFHAELSEHLGPIYTDVSMSLAETASTLFEQIAFEAIFEKLSDREKVVALEQKLNSDVATIFRQIACFNFEKDIHEGIRTKGFLSKEELAALHNKNMQAYLGPIFDIEPDVGYAFVSWPHLRTFFYVYSYAYGMLVSKALLRRYRKDKQFWSKIEKFLSAGGKDSPEKILKEIGIDVSKPSFWKEGLKEIEDDIAKLEKLTKKRA
ncbi:MAG: M3 family metallopeptidase, partial [Candidatus Pacebacteria bacterium]|nr:M3 family metallopeptidase [Candidatus Paceibacterota bacterium]